MATGTDAADPSLDLDGDAQEQATAPKTTQAKAAVAPFLAQAFGFLRHRRVGRTATGAVPGYVRHMGFVLLAQAGVALVVAAQQAGTGAFPAAAALLSLLFLAAYVVAFGRLFTAACDQWVAQDPAAPRTVMLAACIYGGFAVLGFASGFITLSAVRMQGVPLGHAALQLFLFLMAIHAALMVILNRNKSLAARRAL